tara:strand:+ start:176 stop:445 length:270 start_codon:yes stop_codon:yes gene_type:complete
MGAKEKSEDSFREGDIFCFRTPTGLLQELQLVNDGEEFVFRGRYIGGYSSGRHTLGFFNSPKSIRDAVSLLYNYARMREWEEVSRPDLN